MSTSKHGIKKQAYSKKQKHKTNGKNGSDTYSDVQIHSCHSLPFSVSSQNVYAVLDLYGRITAVSIVSSSLLEDMESVKAPSLSSDSCSEGEDDSSPVREVGGA